MRGGRKPWRIRCCGKALLRTRRRVASRDCMFNTAFGPHAASKRRLRAHCACTNGVAQLGGGDSAITFNTAVCIGNRRRVYTLLSSAHRRICGNALTRRSRDLLVWRGYCCLRFKVKSRSVVAYRRTGTVLFLEERYEPDAFPRWTDDSGLRRHSAHGHDANIRRAELKPVSNVRLYMSSAAAGL